MSNGEPKTVRELYFFIKGEFKDTRTEIQNIKKITFWIGGLSGGIITGIILGVIKLVGGKQ